MDGFGFRRSEIAYLKIENLSQVKGRWIAEIKGKGNRMRAVGISADVMNHPKRWLDACGIVADFIFIQINRNTCELRAKPIYPATVLKIVRKYAEPLALSVGVHDLRRTYAHLAYESGAHLEQIQLNLGHSSIAVTERYLGLGFDYSETPSDFINLTIS
jgi:integrase